VPYVRLSSSEGWPHATSGPQLGKTNVGLYCEACGEFITLMVLSTPPGQSGIAVVAEEPQPFECHSCGHLQRRDVSDLIEVKINAANRRKPLSPRAPGVA
jgi:hypothetical protein